MICISKYEFTLYFKIETTTLLELVFDLVAHSMSLLVYVLKNARKVISLPRPVQIGLISAQTRKLIEYWVLYDLVTNFVGRQINNIYYNLFR